MRECAPLMTAANVVKNHSSFSVLGEESTKFNPDVPVPKFPHPVPLEVSGRNSNQYDSAPTLEPL